MGIPAALRGSIVDTMVELPTGRAGMGMDAARRLTKDTGTNEFSHHPAQYLFKDAPERMATAADPDAVVALMDTHGIASALIDVDARHPEHAYELFDRFPGRFFGAVGINPNGGMKALRAFRAAVAGHPMVRAGALAPCLCSPQVDIDAALAYPYYAACCEADIPVLTLVGVPGPRVPFDCQRPERLDRVCYDFPELNIIMRHGGEPWTDLCVKLMLKWPGLHYSTSAFAPKHYPRDVIDYANTRGVDKFVFAGYYPGLSWERVMSELDALGLRDHVWEPFLSTNARRLFKLPAAVTGRAEPPA